MLDSPGPPRTRPTGKRRTLPFIHLLSHAASYLPCLPSATLGVSAWHLFQGIKYHLQTEGSGGHPPSTSRRWEREAGAQTLMGVGVPALQGGGCLGQGEWQVICPLASAPPRVTCITSLSLSFPMCIRNGPRVDQVPSNLIRGHLRAGALGKGLSSTLLSTCRAMPPLTPEGQ